MMHRIQLAAAEIVGQVLAGGKNLNQVLEAFLDGKAGLSTAERGALQDLSYGTLRYCGRLQTELSFLLHKPLSDDRLKNLLLVALYQLQYSRVAAHVVVDNAVRAARKANPKAGGLVNAVLRNFLRAREDIEQRANLEPLGKYSYPQWWIDMLQEQYGDRCEPLLNAGNQHPPMSLRVNRRRSTPEKYLHKLGEAGISARLVEPGAILLDRPVPVDRLPGFMDGWVSVQDAGAQCAAGLLDARDGMRVLDACAAPGGKTAHILESANVEMLAVDKDERRLQRVAENLGRLGLSASLLVGDAQNPGTWWDGRPFQRILADVPCSASGVVRRHPDIKWLRRKEDIDGFANQQMDILCALWRLLERDGKLLYATCSIFQQENERLIETFLSNHPEAKRVPIRLPDDSEGQLLPNDQHDGFFYALLHKAC